jgi:hypothetical protein
VRSEAAISLAFFKTQNIFDKMFTVCYYETDAEFVGAERFIAFVGDIFSGGRISLFYQYVPEIVANPG